MDSEQKYYKNDFFWSLDNSISKIEIDRIKTTAKLIPDDVDSILDVGCGNGVF